MLPQFAAAAIWLSTLIIPSTAQGSTYSGACPLLGLTDPQPATGLASSSTIQTGMKELESTILSAINSSSNPMFNVSQTAFSIDIFSLHSEEALFTYHYTPEALISATTVGVKQQDSSTVFRIGSITKMLAQYAFENKAVLEQGNEIDFVDYDQVTVGSLTNHLAGIGRDTVYVPALQAALEQTLSIPAANNSFTSCGDNATIVIGCNRARKFYHQ